MVFMEITNAKYSAAVPSIIGTSSVQLSGKFQHVEIKINVSQIDHSVLPMAAGTGTAHSTQNGVSKH